MSVFILTRPGFSPERRQKIIARVTGAGFGEAASVAGDYGELTLFHPLLGATHIVRDDNGDYAFCVGLFVYKGATGEAALKQLLATFAPDAPPWRETLGIYACGVCKGGTLHIFNDALGAHKIYVDADDRIVTSAFMVAVHAVNRPQVDVAGCYQYAWNGATFGERTFIREIRTTRFNTLLSIGDAVKVVRFPSPYWAGEDVAADSIDGIAAQMVDRLRENFRTYADVFGDRVNTSLSGGYDSRLILALLLDAGVRPSIFTYGETTDRDVSVARNICDVMDLPLDISVNRPPAGAPMPNFDEQVVARNFAIIDNGGFIGSFGHEMGIENRIKRARDAPITNGSLGEIFRLFYYLPNRRFAKREIVDGFNYRLDPAACTEAFSPRDYCESIEGAMAAAIGSDDDPLERWQVEMVYPLFRGRYWTAQDAVTNQRFGPAVYPYLDLNVVAPTYRLPIAYKSAGRLEANMITLLNPKLASIESDYGFAFDREPTWKYLISYAMSKYRPIGLRRLSYRIQHRSKPAFPTYLTENYLRKVMDDTFPYLSDYFSVGRINDPLAFNRVATMEYILQHWR